MAGYTRANPEWAGTLLFDRDNHQPPQIKNDPVAKENALIELLTLAANTPKSEKARDAKIGYLISLKMNIDRLASHGAWNIPRRAINEECFNPIVRPIFYLYEKLCPRQVP